MSTAKRVQILLLAALSLVLVTNLQAAEQPPHLDCTRPTGADARTVTAAQQAWAKHRGETSHEKKFPLDTAGKVKVEMVLIPPGKYYRGEGNKAVLITLTKPLWVGKVEVTQQQYAAVMGNNPSHFKKSGPEAASYPVEAVSHVSAVKFCEAASENTGTKFRLLRRTLPR